MKIGVMSDLHLGNRQYGSIEREEDFYQQFLDCCKKLDELDCDIVIIAGDIFDKPNPSPKAIGIYRDGIFNLNADVVLAIKGNHTMVLRDNHYSIDSYFNDDNIEGYFLLDDATWSASGYAMSSPYDVEYNKYINEKIKVDGITYRSNSQINEFIEKQKYIADNKAEESTYRILVVHQSFQEYCGFIGEELSINDINYAPYDLIICGHIHSRLCTAIDNDTFFLQPGSIERMNTSEAQDEIDNGKGVYLIDTNTYLIQFYRINPRRKFMLGDIEINSLEDIEKHKKELISLIEDEEYLPVISYKYYNNCGVRVAIADMMTDISKYALINNSNIFDKEEEEIIVEFAEDDLPTINELIMRRDGLSDEEKQLAIDVHNNLKRDNDISGLLEGFREKHFNKAKDIKPFYDKEVEEMIDYFEKL